jgi:hypothetical protein
VFRPCLFGALLLVHSAVGLGGKGGKEAPYEVPAPKGWAKESIALPPAFAPDMAWKGMEELRFAPGMFKVDAEDFFSYGLLFWLSDDQKIDRKTMEQELLAYYRGLATAVLKGKKQAVDAKAFILTITDAKEKPDKRASGESVTAYVGELKWIEPFATGKPQTLRMEIHTWPAEKHRHHCVFIAASPQPESAAVWKALREIRTGCTIR